MRIAYFTSLYPKTSHSFIRRELQALEARGHEVLRISVRRTLLAELAEPADRAELARTRVLLDSPARLLAALSSRLVAQPVRLVRVGVEVVVRGMATGSGFVRPVAYLVEACLLRRWLREAAIDHVHVHFGTNAATVAWIARRLGGPSFSVTLHGPDEWDAPERHRLKEKLADAAFIAVVSSYTGAQLRRWLAPRHWERIHEIHCGVDTSFFERVEPSRRDAVLRLAFVGRIAPQKGIHVLLDALHQWVREGEDVRLVIVGDGELREEIETRVASLDLASYVELLGSASEERVREQILAADALLVPSFAEGLPVVIMEAFALGRPVVSTYIAGIPELIRPGENGWLVPAGDAAALLDALRDLASRSSEDLDAMGMRGRERVRERHDITKEAARLEALIASAHAARR